MIEYKYKLVNKRNGSIFNRIVGIDSPIKTGESNIFKVSGPNGNGKTFLMYLLTCAFAQDKSSQLSDQITQSIKNLNNQSKFDFEYELTIKLDDSKSLFVKKLTTDDEPTLSYEKDGVTINPTSLNEEFEFIYEIPSNIYSKTRDIKEKFYQQYNPFHNNLNKYRQKFVQIKGDLNDKKDSAYVDELKKKIEGLEEALELNKNDLVKQEKREKSFKSIELITQFSPLSLQLATLEKKQKELAKKRKTIPKVDKPKVAGQTTRQKIRQEMENSLAEAIESKREITRVSLENHFHSNNTYSLVFEKFNNINLHELVSRNFGECPFTSIINNYASSIAEYSLTLNSNDFVLKKNAIENFILVINDVFNKYPETEDVLRDTISFIKEDVVNTLNQERKKYDEKVVPIDFVDEITSECVDLINLIKKIRTKSREWENAPDTDQSDLQSKYYASQQIDDQIILNKTAINSAIKRIKQAKANITHQLEGKPFSDTETSKILGSLYKSLSTTPGNWKANRTLNSSNISKSHIKISEKVSGIGSLKDKLTIENNKTEFDVDKTDELLFLTFVDNLQTLEQKLETTLESIYNEDSDVRNNEALSNYFKNSFGGEVVYGKQSKKHKITKVDIFESTISILEGKKEKTLDFTEFSSGQSMSNFLKSSLSNPNNKKLICLFDEVNLMSKAPREQFLDRLRELNQNNQLVFAFLADAGDDSQESLELSHL